MARRGAPNRPFHPIFTYGIFGESLPHGVGFRSHRDGNHFFMGLESYPALVLNADFRPLSYFPLSLWCWQDSIKAVFLERVNVISE